MTLVYPPAPTSDTADEYHGVKVSDPYRPLEDIHAAPTTAWIAAQNRLTQDYLEQIPGRDRLLARLKQLVKYERYGVPAKFGGRYFYTRGDGVRNHDVLLVSDSLASAPRVLLDPNTWSADGTVALAYPRDISLDGRWLLYGRCTGGSDWIEWHVLSVDTGEVLPDVLQWCKFSAWWNRDASGIYYTRFPEPRPGEEYTCQMAGPQTCFHRLGTPQSEDQVLFSLPEHLDWMHAVQLNEERDLLIHQIMERGSGNIRLYFQDLDQPGAPIEHALDANDASYTFVINYGRKILVQTTLDAPNSRLIELDLDQPARENWREVIPQSPLPLLHITTAGNYLFAHYLKDVHLVTYKYRLDGTLVGEIKYPGPGLASGFRGRKDDTEVYYTYQDMAAPVATFRYDTATGLSELYCRHDVPVDPAQYVMREQFYRAPDGTAVPLFVLHKRGLERNGSHPAILYGYGGFGAPLLPYFDAMRLAWLELGGIYAVACIRGGGEYGEAWHEAAIKTKRQTSFDDFVAGAEYLIDQGYTSRERLAILGESNGGTLIGAVMNQHPELCAVAQINVGSLDMLRDNQWGFSSLWEREHGSLANADEFHALYSYSPYHNLRDGVSYPATLVRTGATDDRVMPAHSYKFTARLQACQAADGPPVLLRVELGAGHGQGKPLDKQLRELCDVYAFSLHNMGLPITM